jgi:hypothetical protein
MTTRFDNMPLEDVLGELGRYGHVKLYRTQYVGTERTADRWQCDLDLPTHMGPNIQTYFRGASASAKEAAAMVLEEAEAWAVSPQRAIDRERYLESWRAARRSEESDRRYHGRGSHPAYREALPDIDV